MKKIIFTKLRIRNFLPFGKDPVELTIEPGINFITGDNLDDADSKNGVGKSALVLESVSFLLFGETFRDINNKGIPHNNTKDACVVEGWFTVNEDEYYIIRSLNPSKLILKKNGIDVSRTIPETNKDIIDILGISKDVFVNTIVMTNQMLNTFLTQKTAFKTKFIEGILSLEVFSKMFDDIKALVNEKTKELGKLVIQITEAERAIANDRAYSKREEERVEKEKGELQTRIDVILAEKLEDTQPEMDKNKARLLVIEEEQADFQDKSLKAKLKQEQLTTEARNKNKELSNLNDKKFECPTCRRPLADCDDKDLIENQKTKLREEVAVLKEKIAKVLDITTKINKKLSDLSDEITQIQRNQDKLLKKQKDYDNNQNKIENLKDQLLKLAKWVNPFAQKMEESEKRLEKIVLDHKHIDEYLKIIDAVKLVSSPAGVKPMVVKKIINTLNERLNFYLKRLNAPCTIEFNEFFEETFLHLDGREIGYGNLSGGEAKRVDFALLFTFRDIRRLQSNVFVNISVFDELFDSALDRKGMMNIMDLLKESSENGNEAFYIITHRADNVEAEGCNVITLQKKNGKTRII